MKESSNNATMGLIAVVVLAIIVGGIVFATTGGDDNETTLETTTSQETSEDTAPSDAEAEDVVDVEFADGTYEATGTYSSPAGAETLGVTLTVADNTISDVSFVSGADNPTSQRWQDAFIEGAVSLVTGVNLNDADIVDTVSGSSLTSNGFNNALDEIRAEAQL